MLIKSIFMYNSLSTTSELKECYYFYRRAPYGTEDAVYSVAVNISDGNEYVNFETQHKYRVSM